MFWLLCRLYCTRFVSVPVVVLVLLVRQPTHSWARVKLQMWHVCSEMPPFKENVLSGLCLPSRNLPRFREQKYAGGQDGGTSAAPRLHAGSVAWCSWPQAGCRSHWGPFCQLCRVFLVAQHLCSVWFCPPDVSCLLIQAPRVWCVLWTLWLLESYEKLHYC